MPLNLNIGWSRKVGLPEYGSLGASCNVEIELDSSLLVQDPAAFQDRVRQSFAACQQAVNDQLVRQQGGSSTQHSHGAANGNGSAHGNGAHQEHGSRPSGNGGGARLATQSQARAIRAIAGRHHVDLNPLLRSRFGVSRAEELTLIDASALIDELKTATNGQGGGR